MFKRIGIYGVGLLGGSLGFVIKEKYPESLVVGIGRNKVRLTEALELGAIDQISIDTTDTNLQLDFLIVCTPVRILPQIVKSSLPLVNEGGIITDVGSTKTNVVQACESIAYPQIHFVGSHPIAGSHKSGIHAASSKLYTGKVCIVTETENTNTIALEQVCAFWETVGMRVICMSPDKHDRLLARSSHLPHFVASALCHVAHDSSGEIQSILGSGFRDTTRIAAGDPSIWLDICMDNQKEILNSIQLLQEQLSQFTSWLESGDETKIMEYLKVAQNIRTNVLT